MRALRIDEVSAVDRPAQEGARALLMKRRVPQRDADPASLGGPGGPPGPGVLPAHEPGRQERLLANLERQREALLARLARAKAESEARDRAPDVEEELEDLRRLVAEAEAEAARARA